MNKNKGENFRENIVISIIVPQCAKIKIIKIIIDGDNKRFIIIIAL